VSPKQIQEQLRTALRYIKGAIIQERVEKIPGQAEAKRYFNYPYEAIEEALANAIYHKAHDDREPVEMRVMRDCIHIVSHPGPDRSVTIEGLRDYKVFNRRIGDFLKELQLTEGRNTGFGKIIHALERNGSPLPLFDTNDTRDYFTTTLYIHPEFLNNETGTWTSAGNNSAKLEVNERSLSEVLSEVSLRKLTPLIAHIEEVGFVTPRQAQELIRKSDATTRRYLGILLETGHIEKQGKTNNIKYVRRCII
jgi:ATP-dependent DNA helicase RecG